MQERRIQFAREVLQKHFLPHIGIEEGKERDKAFFLGYMVHRLLLAALGRRPEDDRYLMLFWVVFGGSALCGLIFSLFFLLQERVM